jgi:hypothetical protein
MFLGYQKFKIAFPGLFNSFTIHSEALVTAVFRQVIVSNSFHLYRLKNKLQYPPPNIEHPPRFACILMAQRVSLQLAYFFNG